VGQEVSVKKLLLIDILLNKSSKSREKIGHLRSPTTIPWELLIGRAKEMLRAGRLSAPAYYVHSAPYPEVSFAPLHSALANAVRTRLNVPKVRAWQSSERNVAKEIFTDFSWQSSLSATPSCPPGSAWFPLASDLTLPEQSPRTRYSLRVQTEYLISQ
jgi:hypothetical protein